VWAIESYRAGETTQVLGLAEAIVRRFGGVHETFRYRHKFRGGPLSLAMTVGTGGIEAVEPREFGPPWPDLLISAGVRNEPVARWIRQASGGHTRIVFLGRVWAPAPAFDLVVVTPQYRFPAAASCRACTRTPMIRSSRLPRALRSHAVFVWARVSAS
jgi:mitochondrial fission protein ELM1